MRSNRMESKIQQNGSNSLEWFKQTSYFTLLALKKQHKLMTSLVKCLRMSMLARHRISAILKHIWELGLPSARKQHNTSQVLQTTVLKFNTLFQMDKHLQKEVEVSHRNASLLMNALLLLLSIFVLPGELGTLLFCTYVRLQWVSDVVPVCHFLSKSNIFSTCHRAKNELPTLR